MTAPSLDTARQAGHGTATGWPAARFTARNLAGLLRYLLLRLRYRNFRVGLFFVDRGADIRIGPAARVRFGRGTRFMRDFSGHFYGEVTIGANVFFNRGCNIVVHEALFIGDNCLFGEMVSIHDENHVAGRGPEPLSSRGFLTAPVVIGANVWVGAKATIVPGVHIGNNAIIGANAVVTRDVPANTVAVGIPARVVREI
jgi:acetyltransferase-like isoleucine patch superfamily enzyme